MSRSKALSSVQDKSFKYPQARRVDTWKPVFPSCVRKCINAINFNQWCATIDINPTNPVDAINIINCLVDWRIEIAIVARDLRWSPPTIEERDRAGYIPYPLISLLILTPRWIAGFRLTPDFAAAPADFVPPTPSRRLVDAMIDALIALDCCCLVFPGRPSDETWKGVSVSYEKKKTHKGRLFTFFSVRWNSNLTDIYQMLF